MYQILLDLLPREITYKLSAVRVMPHYNEIIVLIVIIYSPENCLMVLALQCNKYNTLSHLLS